MNFMEWLAKVFEFLKLPLRIIAFFAIITGMLLFLPANLLSRLKLTEFISEYGKYLGIAFIVSAAYIPFTLIPIIYKNIRGYYKSRKAKKYFLANISETLENLSYPEKCLLR